MRKALVLLALVPIACGGAPRPMLAYEPPAPDVSIADRDHDGIADAVDKCPDDPEDKDGFQDADGCPDPDNDVDGLLDKDDDCPNEPEDKDGFEDTDGCPDPDNDHDGILDKDDACPNQPENFNGIEDDDGCPDQGAALIRGNHIVLTQPIVFVPYSAAIDRPQSLAAIDALVAMLMDHQEIELIEVQVFEPGVPSAYLQKLSENRSDSLVRALMNHGIATTRVRPQGFGAYCTQPTATATSIELPILRTTKGRTGVPLGCANATANGVKSKPVP